MFHCAFPVLEIILPFPNVLRPILIVIYSVPLEQTRLSDLGWILC
jgi:hypothetical protein